jgi:hypothetical protein
MTRYSKKLRKIVIEKLAKLLYPLIQEDTMRKKEVAELGEIYDLVLMAHQLEKDVCTEAERDRLSVLIWKAYLRLQRMLPVEELSKYKEGVFYDG